MTTTAERSGSCSMVVAPLDFVEAEGEAELAEGVALEEEEVDTLEHVAF